MKLNKLLAGGVAALATTSLVALTTGVASADPARDYAAVGSDTIQDVWNGLTNDAGAPLPQIASYNAFDNIGQVANIQTKTGGAWFTRPSGSGNGAKALSAVWDSTNHAWQKIVINANGTSAATVNTTTTVQLGQGGNEEIDFSRSSSGPSGANDQLTYLPFARDAVDLAFFPTTGLTSLDISRDQIIELYSGIDNATDDGATVVKITQADGTTPATTAANAAHAFINGVEVHPKVPQSGSGTRGFFLTNALGVTALAGYISDPGDSAHGGLPENDGAALTSPGDVYPFSVAQWIAQKNGKVANTTGTLVLATIGGVAPTTGTAPALSPGALYGTAAAGNYTTVPASTGVFNRDTYDVVPSTYLTAGTAKQQLLTSLFTTSGGLGGNTAKSIIKSFGFGTLSYYNNTSNFRHGNFQH
jgi:hypothetical protein